MSEWVGNDERKNTERIIEVCKKRESDWFEYLQTVQKMAAFVARNEDYLCNVKTDCSRLQSSKKLIEALKEVSRLIYCQIHYSHDAAEFAIHEANQALFNSVYNDMNMGTPE